MEREQAWIIFTVWLFAVLILIFALSFQGGEVGDLTGVLDVFKELVSITPG